MSTESIQPEDFIKVELQKFTLTDAAIAEMRANYLTIKVADFNDKENAALARSRRLEVKDLRVATNKMREEMKADSIKFGKAVEKKAQSIIKPLAEIEAYLQEQEDIVAKHKEREEAKERARIAAENEAERQRLEVERQKIESERAEIERQKAEIEQARKVNAERETISSFAAAESINRPFRFQQGDEGLAPDDQPRHQVELTIEQRALSLLNEFYELNAAGIFTLPDNHYHLITATAQLIQEAAKTL